jgi:hypothetical protein
MTMAKLSKPMLEALREVERYLADPWGHPINRTYNRSTRAYTDKASHCYTEWFPACTEAGLVPDSFHLRRCWTRTSRALVTRGLLEWAPYDWSLRGEPRKGWGLRLTEAGRAALAREA